MRSLQPSPPVTSGCTCLSDCASPKPSRNATRKIPATDFASGFRERLCARPCQSHTSRTPWDLTNRYEHTIFNMMHKTALFRSFLPDSVQALATGSKTPLLKLRSCPPASLLESRLALLLRQTFRMQEYSMSTSHRVFVPLGMPVDRLE